MADDGHQKKRIILFAVAMAQMTSYWPFFSFSNMWKTNSLRSNDLLKVKVIMNLVICVARYVEQPRCCLLHRLFLYFFLVQRVIGRLGENKRGRAGAGIEWGPPVRTQMDASDYKGLKRVKIGTIAKNKFPWNLWWRALRMLVLPPPKKNNTTTKRTPHNYHSQ